MSLLSLVRSLTMTIKPTEGQVEKFSQLAAISTSTVFCTVWEKIAHLAFLLHFLY